MSQDSGPCLNFKAKKIIIIISQGVLLANCAVLGKIHSDIMVLMVPKFESWLVSMFPDKIFHMNV